MISAKQAREKTDENKIRLRREEIDKAIRKAVENGRDKVTITGQIPACIILELQENGFRTNNGLIEW
jgi:acetylglutamate kinase